MTARLAAPEGPSPLRGSAAKPRWARSAIAVHKWQLGEAELIFYFVNSFCRFILLIYFVNLFRRFFLLFMNGLRPRRGLERSPSGSPSTPSTKRAARSPFINDSSASPSWYFILLIYFVNLFCYSWTASPFINDSSAYGPSGALSA